MKVEGYTSVQHFGLYVSPEAPTNFKRRRPTNTNISKTELASHWSIPYGSSFLIGRFCVRHGPPDSCS